MKNFKKVSLIMLSAFLIFACSSDPDPVAVSGITAEGTSFQDGSTITSDLNGVSSAEGVALNAVITITFDMAINTATATNTNITLSTGGNAVASSVNASGSSATLTPNADLERGTTYTLSISGVESAEKGTLTSVSRTFITEGKAPVIVPQVENMLAYWSFNGTADSEDGAYVASRETDVSYGTDRFGIGASTASFNGNTSVIVVPNGDDFIAGDSYTMSFWVKTNSVDHLNQDGNPEGHFVLGCGGFSGYQFEINANANNEYPSCKFANSYYIDASTFLSEDAFFAGDGKFSDNGGWQGWDFQADLSGAGGVNALIKDKWLHVVTLYDAPTKTHRMFFNGELMKGHDFNLWPDGDLKRDIAGVAFSEPAKNEVTTELTFGFIHGPTSTRWADTGFGDYNKPTAKHFKGDLDDVRFFSTAFSAADVKALYDAEKN
jgi:hypothetical protein